MKTAKLYLLGTLVLVLFIFVPAIASVSFTGDVEFDFPPGPGVLIIEDPAGPNEITVDGNDSGWDIKDLRLAYDDVTDTLFVGINSWNIVGDVDGNGCPDTATSLKYLDESSLGGGESVAVYFDLDFDEPFSNNSNWDVIAGVGNGLSIAGFTVATFTGNFDPPNNFGPELTGHVGTNSDSPDVNSPDFEFAILNFSTLASSLGLTDPKLNEFRVGAYMGSPNDGIENGEDFVYYHQRPSTVVTITPSEPAVIEGGTVDLIVTETNYSTAFVGELAGPTDPCELSLSNVRVVVTKNGSPLDILMDPPESGDNGNNMLDRGETWIWTIPSVTITEYTEFIATGSGFCPPEFFHTYPEDPNERAETSVEVLSAVLSTDVGITADPETVICEQTVDLVVTELNDGGAPLTNVSVDVSYDNGGGPTPLVTLTTPPDSGDDGNTVLDPGETWVWTIPSVAVTTTTTFTATGSAEYDGITVTYPGDPNEQESVTVPMMCGGTEIDIKANGSDGPITVREGYPVTLTICEENTGEVDLTDPYVELHAGTSLIALLDVNSPDFTGGDVDSDGELDAGTPGEEWCWDVNVPDANGTYIAIGYGYLDGMLVTWCTDLGNPPDGIICDQNEIDVVTVNTEPCGGEGCNPGFWKNNGDKHGASAWCDDLAPSTRFSSVFILNEPLTIRGKGKSTITDPTLLQALGANGGGVNAMIRHGVAALLNACSDCVNYPINNPFQIVIMIEDTLNEAPGAHTVDELHSMFASYNEAGCPVNQHGECVGVEE